MPYPSILALTLPLHAASTYPCPYPPSTCRIHLSLLLLSLYMLHPSILALTLPPHAASIYTCYDSPFTGCIHHTCSDSLYTSLARLVYAAILIR
ncbi:hypothetical protein RRG08_028943 [Elysia crispata]|uniref:Uncharacterized protein n=1 Tax=Elysia crispata TaxID=231223 RepID=A0AAE1APR8_9GAST|nr:hypothetical protein RRG08_028943 [Elysia crispata]